MDALPTCALQCLAKAAKQAACMPTDPACVCENQKLQTLLQPCILQTCSVKEAFTAKAMSDTNCGVPVEGKADDLVIVSTIFMVIAIICTIVRVAARIIGRNLGMDDLAIICALGIAIAIGAIAFPIRDLGLGMDIWHVPFDNITHVLYLFNILTTVYPACISCIKLSMLFLYLRLFPNTKLRWITIISSVLLAIWGTIYTLIGIWVCSPRSFAWERWDMEHQGTCLNQSAIVESHAIENIVFDIFVIALPMPVLWSLKLSMPKKIGVSFMFLIGLVVTIMSILRLKSTFGVFKSTNPTRDFVPISIWSVLEIDLGIICACLPGMRAFFKFLFPSPETTGRSYDHSTGNSGSAKNPKSFNLSVSSSGRVRPSAKQDKEVPLNDYSSRRALVSPVSEEDTGAPHELGKMRTALYNSE